MSKTIGIFKGKQATRNKQLLQTLYDHGPLTAWQITGKLTKHGKVSLHATLNKRLHDLEKKGYVKKIPKTRRSYTWILNFKGFMANLLLQSKPKPWNKKWNKITEFASQQVKNYDKPLAPKEKEKLDAMLKGNLNLSYDEIENFLAICSESMHDYSQLVHLSSEVQKLMKEGVINFDVIKNETLAKLLIWQQRSFLDDILEPPRTKG